MGEGEPREWDVACASCGLAVGEIVDGRFAHHADCAEPTRVEGGAQRCCACGGKLTGTQRPLVLNAAPETTARITQFAARRVASKGR